MADEKIFVVWSARTATVRSALVGTYRDGAQP